MERTILHCDCNSYFTSMECLDRSKLKRVALVACCDPRNHHGVILAKVSWKMCGYQNRIFVNKDLG